MVGQQSGQLDSSAVVRPHEQSGRGLPVSCRKKQGSTVTGVWVLVFSFMTQAYHAVAMSVNQCEYAGQTVRHQRVTLSGNERV